MKFNFAKTLLEKNTLIAFSAIPILLYCTLFLCFGVNVPVGDDYALLGFFHDFQQSTTTGEKISILFSVHNEHRIFVTRSIILLANTIFGELDFRLLTAIGNAALLAAIYQLIKSLQLKNDYFSIAFLILIIIQPQPLKLIFYPMAVIQSYWALFFSILYLRFLLENKSIGISLLFYLLAILCTGSGIFLVIIGVPILFLQKRYKDLVISFSVFLFSSLLYFQGGSPLGNSGLRYVVENPIPASIFFFSLLGGAAQVPKFSGFSLLPMAVGVIFMGYYLWIIISFMRHKENVKNLTYIVFSTYMVLQIVMIVIGRTKLYSQNLVEAALDGRYRIYSLVFVGLMLTHFFNNKNVINIFGKRLKAFFLLLAILFNAGWFVIGFLSAKDLSENRLAAMKMYIRTGDASQLDTWAVDKKIAINNLSSSVETGIYKPR